MSYTNMIVTCHSMDRRAKQEAPVCCLVFSCKRRRTAVNSLIENTESRLVVKCSEKYV